LTIHRKLFFLLGFLASTAFAADSFWTPLTWPTEDAVQLVGLYHPAVDATHLTWVLQHGLGSSKEEWDLFARQLAATGQGVLIFDARGHGASQKTTGGQAVSYPQFARDDWDHMPDDIGTTIRFLTKKYNLHSEKIAVGGASLGANVVLVYAAHASEVPAVLLLSPGIEYAGINIDRAYTRYGKRPLLMAASPEDRYAFQSVQALALRRTDASLRLIEGPDHQHGVNMLNPSVTARILDWMKGLH
jgi:pimeloyl-ACP methyl ester carboxylesterase